MSNSTNIDQLSIRPATDADCDLLLSFIRQLAEYEKLSHEVVATPDKLRETLFGERPMAESVIGFYQEEPVCFALFFHNYSTFLGQAGLYLEDLFVIPEMRGRGFGKVMLSYLAKLSTERGCGRFEWSVLDWNEPALNFYRSIGARPMEDWTVQRLEGTALQALASQFSGRTNL